MNSIAAMAVFIVSILLFGCTTEPSHTAKRDISGLRNFIDKGAATPGYTSVWAVSAKPRYSARRIASHSSLNGPRPFKGTVKDITTLSYPRLALAIRAAKGVTVGEASIARLDSYASTASELLTDVFGDRFRAAIDLVIIPPFESVDSTARSRVKNGRFSLTFYFPDDILSANSVGPGTISGLTHELHHAFIAVSREAAKAVSAARDFSSYQIEILGETEADVFSACADLRSAGMASVSGNMVYEINGRWGTLTDSAIKKVLVPGWKLKGADALALRESVATNLFWTLWRTYVGEPWELAHKKGNGEMFYALCNREILSSPLGILPVFQKLASDGVDAPQIDPEEVSREYRNTQPGEADNGSASAP